MTRHDRLDRELVRRGLARSREQAVALVSAGRVTLAGRPATKPATGVARDTPIVVQADERDPGYASRGAHKLAGALTQFQVPVAGRRCLDAGASTGGFTDVLLRAGAAQVHAVDVGYGQLAWSLRTDPRVVVHDRVNVRSLTAERLGGRVDLAVADLSFISLTVVLPALLGACRPGADLVVLVKPQFEVGRGGVGAGGVVRDEALRAAAVAAVAVAARGRGATVRGVAPSVLPGPAGNVEYLLWLSLPAGEGAPAPGLAGEDVRVAVLGATALVAGR